VVPARLRQGPQPDVSPLDGRARHLLRFLGLLERGPDGRLAEAVGRIGHGELALLDRPVPAGVLAGEVPEAADGALAAQVDDEVVRRFLGRALKRRVPPRARVAVEGADGPFAVGGRLAARADEFVLALGDEAGGRKRFDGPKGAGFSGGLLAEAELGLAVALVQRGVAEGALAALFVGGLGEGDHLGQDIGFLAGQVFRFRDIGGQVVEFPPGLAGGALLALSGPAGRGTDGLPLAHADGGPAADFPVEVLVLGLFAAGGVRAQEFGHDGDAVDVVGRLAAGQFGQRRQDVWEVPEEVARAAGFDVPGPGHDHRDPQAALVQGALLASERHARFRVDVGPVETAGMVLVAEVVHAAVVAAEEDNRVALQAQFLQQGTHLADVPVHHVDHGGVASGRLGPGLVLVKGPRRVVVGDVVDAVRRRDGQVAEERAVLIRPDEFQGLVHDDVVGVGPALAAALVARERDFFAVADDVRGIVRVGVDLVVVAQEDVEAVLLGDAGRPPAAAAPLAEAARGVARALQDGGDGLLLGPERRAAVVLADVFAGHQAAPRGGAHAGAG